MLKGYSGKPSNKNFENKDVKELISPLNRSLVRDVSRLEKARPWVVIPEEFYNATTQMCNTERETRGVLLTKMPNNVNERYVVEAMLTIGYGTSVGVFLDEDKFKAIKKLLSLHPEIKGIDFHSHTVATGASYYDKFSDHNGGDIDSLKNNINKNPNYKHILFTPTHIISFGLELPQVLVSDFTKKDAQGLTLPNPSQTQHILREEFNCILEEIRRK